MHFFVSYTELGLTQSLKNKMAIKMYNYIITLCPARAMYNQLKNIQNLCIKMKLNIFYIL